MPPDREAITSACLAEGWNHPVGMRTAHPCRAQRERHHDRSRALANALLRMNDARCLEGPGRASGRRMDG